MVKCTNCGAEIPTDASFCENCGAKVTPAVATPPPPPAAVPPPPPAATQVTYPPPPPTTPEKKGPPMKTIGIVVAVIIVVLGGVLFMANSATRGLSVSLQSGSVITTYPLPGDITITLSLNIENPGFMSVEVVNNYLTIRCRSSGRQATFYSGYVSELRGTYSGSTLKTVTITLPWGTWANDASIVAVWVWGCWNEAPMQMEIEGTLDTRSLFLTGTSTVSVDWISVRGY